jgi:hypothetical protein
MARKPLAKPFVHQKATTVELSDGWNLVTKSKARTSLAPSKDKFFSSSSTALPCNETNIASQIKDVENHFEQWKSSKCCAKLTATLELWKARGQKIDNAICIGLGSISDTNLNHNRRSLWQLAVFIYLSRFFSAPDDSPPTALYAQEPSFTPLDVAVLKSYRVEVLEDMNARDYIIPNTLLFTPFLPWAILLQDVLFERDPAICFTLDIRNCSEQLEIMTKDGREQNFEGQVMSKEKLDVSLKVGMAFLEGKTDVKFPDFELHSSALLGLRIYLNGEREGLIGD